MLGSETIISMPVVSSQSQALPVYKVKYSPTGTRREGRPTLACGNGETFGERGGAERKSGHLRVLWSGLRVKKLTGSEQRE